MDTLHNLLINYLILFIIKNKTMKQKLTKDELLEIKKTNKAFDEMIRKFKHALIN